MVVVRRAGVQEQRTLDTEEQERERRLEVRVLALPQNDRVIVVPVYLPGRIGPVPTRGRPMDPAHVQAARGRLTAHES